MKRAGEVLSALFDERFMKKAGEYSALFSCWKDLMEKNGIAAAADHSRIKSLDRGLVWVEADHPGWKQILQTKESKLLSDFRRRFPDTDISGLSIVLGKPGAVSENPDNGLPPPGSLAPVGGLAAETPAPEKQCSVAVPPASGVQKESGYEAIKDGALKETLMRLERSVMERNVEKNVKKQ
jgi:hypothetical protein